MKTLEQWAAATKNYDSNLLKMKYVTSWTSILIGSIFLVEKSHSWNETRSRASSHSLFRITWSYRNVNCHRVHCLQTYAAHTQCSLSPEKQLNRQARTETPTRICVYSSSYLFSSNHLNLLHIPLEWWWLQPHTWICRFVDWLKLAVVYFPFVEHKAKTTR
jgi:hypothetical protein